MFGLAAASAAGAAVAGMGGGTAFASGGRLALATAPPKTQSFFSRPDLKPPVITVHQYGHVAQSRYTFLNAPYSAAGHGGAMILDSAGELVWFGPNTATEHKMDFNAQDLDGQPVLTWWQGLLHQGHGEGEAIIADSSYQVKYVIQAQNGLKVDLHEFVVTPQGTALISAYRTHSGVDLSSIGGPASGYLCSGVVQEIDIASGELLFEWDSYDPANPPIAPAESYLPLEPGQGTQARPFDYLHLNSIDQAPDGDFIVSGRHTWTIYKISKADGSILWRMNGKKSDFTMGPGASYLWQHHVRSHAHDQLTVFDNADGPVPPHQKRSRALILAYDTTSQQVSLKKAYAHPGQVVLAEAMGSAEILPGGDMFVDWGFATRFSQFSADGRLLIDATMSSGAPSYRGFSRDWAGQPTDRPAVAVRRTSAGATVYASWNGATNVASWTVLAGTTGTSLAPVATVRRTGFETAIAVHKTARYFAAQANDASGQALSTSNPTKID